MPIRFTYGEVSRVLKHPGFQKTAKSSSMYEGVCADGKPHICKMDCPKDRDQAATGTAFKIAKSLGFSNVAEMKHY